VVRIGIIGKGFGERVVAPAFRETHGCEVVDVVSPREERAVAALCARRDLDLVSVHSPPFLHVEHVRRAIEGGHAVLCDKPFGRNAGEAREMCHLASEAGVVALLNFEMRYDPARRRLRDLVLEGAVGEPEHFQSTMLLATTRVPLRSHGWLFDADLGGGWLRALGSHLFDFARWTFGEIAEASGDLRTAVRERPDAGGRLHRSTADDGFTALLRSASGVTMTIDSSSAAAVNLTPATLVVGGEAVLEMLGDQRIVRHGSAGREDVWAAETAAGNPLVASMRQWAAVVRDAVGRGTAEAGTPTFADGLACVEVMDRVRGG
jgi:predicted dehydrogenase